MSDHVSNVLILEDSKTQAKLISKMFRDAGCYVEFVTSAEEFHERSGRSETAFDVAIVDVHFGDVSGLTLLAPIRRRWPSCVLAMMTANQKDDYSDLADGREMGADLVMPKPFSAENVAELLVDTTHIQNNGQRRKHIVVIDDSRAICRITRQILESFGYRVSTFQSGLDAIQQLSYDHVDIVVSDINMPEMSGDELIDLVRDVWEDVGIVAMSGDLATCKKIKLVDAFVQKPVVPEQLYSAIRHALGQDLDVFELAC